MRVVQKFRYILDSYMALTFRVFVFIINGQQAGGDLEFAAAETRRLK